MKKIIMAVFLGLISLSLLGCYGSTRSNVGTVGGAVVGGLAGRAITGGSTAGTIVGAAGGALAGKAIAESTEPPPAYEDPYY